MKKRKVRRRNPVARAVRLIRPTVVPSVKAYSRKPKHKGHSDINRNDLFLFCRHDSFCPCRGFAAPRFLVTPPPIDACG